MQTKSSGTTRKKISIFSIEFYSMQPKSQLRKWNIYLEIVQLDKEKQTKFDLIHPKICGIQECRRRYSEKRSNSFCCIFIIRLSPECWSISAKYDEKQWFICYNVDWAASEWYPSFWVSKSSISLSCFVASAIAYFAQLLNQFPCRKNIFGQ